MITINPLPVDPSLPPEEWARKSRGETRGVAVWYLGQVGFLFQHGGTTVLVDPYLTDSVDRLAGFPEDFWVRNYPPPFSPQKLDYVDLVLCTHDHLDHADPGTLQAIAQASPDCCFAGPKLSVAEFLRAGIPEERTVILNDHVPFQFRQVLIEPIAAAHEEYESDAGGFHRFLSYLITWAGLKLFHAGDTVETPELGARLSREKIDMGFLPINGGDDQRRAMGIVGNLHPGSAARLAAEHHFGFAVPTHYDLYKNNSGRVEDFIDELTRTPAPHPQPKIFSPGEGVLLTR